MKLHEIRQLDEVELVTDISKSHKTWADTKVFMGKKYDKTKFGKSVISSGKLAGGTWVFINTEHRDFQDLDIPYYGSDYVLLAMNEAGKVQVGASFYKNGKSYNVDHLVSRNGSTIPAHKMYAALIKSGEILTSSSQSEGGMKVWMKLSAEPGIVVHGWDKVTRKPINLGPKFDDPSDTHSSYGGWFSKSIPYDDVDPEDERQERHERYVNDNIILVAAKK